MLFEGEIKRSERLVQSMVPVSHCVSYASWEFLKTQIFGPCFRSTESEFTKEAPRSLKC